MAKSSNQSGIVSLLTSIIVGLLLIVITVSAVALMSGELRQATDFDNSVKAYFAAESGVEDAISYIRNNRVAGSGLGTFAALNKNNCNPNYGNPNLSGDNVVKYTCQIVDTQPNQLTGQLNAEESTQLNFIGVSGYSKLLVQWNQGATSDLQNWTPIPANFSSASFGNWNWPAVVEATIVEYPTTPDFAQSSVVGRTLVLKPSTGGGMSSIPYTNPAGTKPVPVNCTAPVGTNFGCIITLDTLTPSTRNYIVRLTARYKGMHYQVSALPSAATGPSGAVALPNAQMTVDVTASSGDVFRRVRVQAPLGGVPNSNFALLADVDLCKVIQVSAATGFVVGSETGCN